MAYKLGKFFNISPRFWINLQTYYEMKLFEQNSYNKLEMVKAYSVV